MKFHICLYPHALNICIEITEQARPTNLCNERRYVCLSVCLSVSMFRMAGQTAGPIETKLDTRTHVQLGSFCQGQCQGHSCMRAGVTELRNTRNAARKRHLANAYESPSGRRVITARVTRWGAAGAKQRVPKARGASRTPSGGRVITASIGYIRKMVPDHTVVDLCSKQHQRHSSDWP